MQLYYGHKYPASMINTNKVLYKVSFYPTMTGAFSLHVYTANAGNGKPQTQVYTQDITVSGTSWNDIVLNTPLQLDASKDLWVFIYDPEGKSYPMGAGSYEGTDSNGNYISTSTPTSSVSVQGVVMLINTYITDGNLDITVTEMKEPLVGGIGVGLRTTIFGYFIRGDVAWGIEEGQIAKKPRFYLSFNLDF